jgi:hypothetical protein
MTSDPLARRAAAQSPLSAQFTMARCVRPPVLDLSDPDVRAMSIEALALALAALDPGSDHAVAPAVAAADTTSLVLDQR